MYTLHYKSGLLLAFALFSVLGLVAQNSSQTISEEDLLLALILTMIMVAFVSLLLVLTIFVLIRQKREAKSTAEVWAADTDASPAFLSWAWINAKMTNAVPVEQESTIDMGHNYDGIRELDNNLPPWWKYGFYLTIVFSVLYMGYYHFFTDWSSEGEYLAAMEEHHAVRADYLARQVDMVNESSVTLLTDAASLQAGGKIYQVNCMPCHGEDGGGNAIGPNLTDEYWIHGGSVNNVFSTIKYGVIEKGMTPWQDILKPSEMQQVASYILEELQGTTPVNPKEPQGELYVPEPVLPDASADSASIVTLIQ